MARSAILISADRFDESESLANLNFPGIDAKSLGELFADRNIGHFDSVKHLHNATRADVGLAIERISSDALRGDLILFYYSGHGLLDRQGKLLFALPETSDRYPSHCSISADWVTSQFASSRASQRCILLDCCYSGGVGQSGIKSSGVQGALQSISQIGSGTFVLTASTQFQVARERPGIGGVFTAAMLEGIRSGRAASALSDDITFDGIAGYVRKHLSENGEEQEPQSWTGGSTGELVLARRVPQLNQLWMERVELALWQAWAAEEITREFRSEIIAELMRLESTKDRAFNLINDFLTGRTRIAVFVDYWRRMVADRAAILADQERAAKAKVDQERAAKLKAEQERAAKAKADQERAAKLKAEQERAAKAKADQERAAKLKAEQERAAKAKADQERAAKLKAEQERAAKAKVDQERAAKLKAEQERAAKAKADQERAAKLKAEQERAAKAKADQERAAKAKADQERAAKAKADEEHAARLKAEQESVAKAAADHGQAAKAKADQERIAAVKAEQERAANAKANHERSARLKADQERAARFMAEQERAAKLKDERERATRLKAEQERAAAAKAEHERAKQQRRLMIWQSFIVGIIPFVFGSGYTILLSYVLIGALSIPIILAATAIFIIIQRAYLKRILSNSVADFSLAWILSLPLFCIALAITFHMIVGEVAILPDATDQRTVDLSAICTILGIFGIVAVLFAEVEVLNGSITTRSLFLLLILGCAFSVALSLFGSQPLIAVAMIHTAYCASFASFHYRDNAL